MKNEDIKIKWLFYDNRISSNSTAGSISNFLALKNRMANSKMGIGDYFKTFISGCFTDNFLDQKYKNKKTKTNVEGVVWKYFNWIL